jgi:plastocyanin
MRLRAVLAVSLLTLLVVPSPRADTNTVNIVDFAFNPPRLVALAGDTIGWRNGSFVNKHTVTGSGFESGPIVPGGGFFRDFTAPGAYTYVCTIHPGMSGEVDVYRLLLSGPGREVARGAPTILTGRVAAGIGKVTIEEDTGAGFHPVATASAEAGSFRATVHPPASASYRAVSGPDASGPVPVQVSDRNAVTASASGRRVRVRVEPFNPGASVSLQLKLRERFGWWTVARARLDKESSADFRVRRPRAVWARVVLTQSDRWTPLAASAPVRIRPSP